MHEGAVRMMRLTAWSLVVVCAAAACTAAAEPKGTIDIGSDASNIPNFDVAVRDGAAFAVAQARTVRSYPLRFVPYDDSVQGAYSADQGAENVHRMVLDPNMLGMVGPLRTPVAVAEMPIANRASLAMISPTNTEPCLTQPSSICTFISPAAFGGLRPTGKNNYFRIAATEQLHGAAMAEFAYGTLGLRRIAVVGNAYPAGKSASDKFTAAFAKAGGTVVSRQDFDFLGGGAPDFRPWLQQAKAAGAEAIYAGGLGVYPLDPRVQSEGIFDPSSYYLGIDGSPDLFKYGIAEDDITPAVSGVMVNDHIYASRGIGAPYLNPSAADTIAAFIKVNPDPAENNSQTFAGYDSAAILIDAIGRAIDANGGKMPSRQQVVDQLSKTTNFHGLTGIYTFTDAGDPVTPTLQILQYKGDAWKPVRNVTV
jgi:branched-chain amino acid transport system substrate-binding protein